MARCACAQATCQCVVQDTPTVDFSGAGSAAVPYEADVIPTGLAPLLVSTDAGNTLQVGTDGLLKTGGPFTLFSSGVQACNAAGGLATLKTFNVPGGTLAVNGDRLKWRAVILLNTFAFDFNAFFVRYGGVVIMQKTLTSGIDAAVVCEGEIIRTAAAAQTATSSAVMTDNAAFGTGASAVDIAVLDIFPALNNAAANTFLIEGQSGGAAQQVCVASLTIDYHPI